MGVWVGECAVDGVCETQKSQFGPPETWQLAVARLTAPVSSRQRVINTKTTPGGVVLRPFYFGK